MKTARFIQMGRLGVVLGLCVACEGKMRSLGDEEATAGAAGTAGSDAQGIGRGGAGVGGAGVGGAGVGGAIAGGPGIGRGGVAGSAGGPGIGRGGVAGSAGVLPYVLAPTLPLDPACTCSSPEQICNAARQCVPRCDSAGRCAMWLSPHGVVDLHVDGTTVFILTAMAYDPLGNPVSDGSLYRADYPNIGEPTLVATGIKDPATILGRYKGATYVSTSWPSNSLVRVTDEGTATTIASSNGNTLIYSSMLGNWITYADASGKNLWGIELDGDLVPQLLIALETVANLDAAPLRTISAVQTLTDYFWFVTVGANSPWICYLTRANLALGPICLEPGGWHLIRDVLAASGNQVYVTADLGSRLDSVDITGKTQLKVFSAGNASDRKIMGATYSDGWLYSVVSNPGQLVRYPATVGRLPQEVLPTTVAQPTVSGVGTPNPDDGFAVSSLGVFWFQGVTDLNQPQYIFHAPLPPQPCDAELPCADSAFSCVAGYCAAAQ